MNYGDTGSGFWIDDRDERLWRGATSVSITNKAFRLLQYLVANPGRLLTKDEILDNVWPLVHVSEGLIKEYVHDLRRALGDDPKAPRFIETVRGRGYRFLGGIERCLDPGDAADFHDFCENNAVTTSPGAAAAMALAGPPRVVVLPWLYFGDGDRLELFARGFSAELTDLLAKNRDLTVIAKSSAAVLRREPDRIGRARHDLRANYVIEGELLADDGGVRLAVTAVNTETEAIVWSDCFAVPGSKLAIFESELAPRMATAVGARSGALYRDATISAKRRLPADLTAFEHYLLALDAFAGNTKQGLARARTSVDCALAKDPLHAQSWLLLSYILEAFENGAATDEAAELAGQERCAAIGRAVAADPFDGRILIEHADCLYGVGDSEGSRDRYAEAYRMCGGLADMSAIMSKYLAGVFCDADAARRLLADARDFNPTGDAVLALNELRTFYLVGDFDAALKAGDGCPDIPLRALFVALSHLERNDLAAARDVVLEGRTRHDGFEPQRFIKSHYYVRDSKVRARFEAGLRQLSDCARPSASMQPG